MLENLLSLVTQNANQAIVQNNAIPNENNDAAIQAVTQSIMGGLQDQVQAGNHDGLLSLLGGKSDVMNNPIVSQLAQGAAGQLMDKFGVDSGAAQQIVAQLIPTVMQQMVQKTNNPADSSFDLGGVVGALSGGNVPSGLGGLLSQFMGGSK